MEIEALLKRIELEKQKAKTETHSEDGLLRLQRTMENYQGEDKLYTSNEIVEQLKTQPPIEGFKTGIEPLDNLTGGFRRKQTVVMFAQTKHGKTEVGMWLMSLFPELSPVLIPLEQDASELISQRQERGYSIPYFLAPLRNDAFVLTDWVEERVIEGIAKYNAGMVVIDHLGYIDTNGTKGKWARENLAYRIGQTMKEIRHIGEKWNVLVVLLVHVSDCDEGKPPQLTDIGNSSDIKKESDTVISIWRKNSMQGKIRMYENKTMLSVLANRRFGKNGNVGLAFDTTTGIYSEDNAWVKAMEETAQRQIDVDNEFDA